MAQTNDTVVKTIQLTKIFRDFWLRRKVAAVTDLDLEIRPGEVFGLLGPNGSGKTTTIKMILGLLFPTRGRVTVFGRSPTDVETKSRIGFLPEESYLYPFLDAYETLDFYGRLFRMPRSVRNSRIETLLDMVGLKAAAYRRIGEYSKGMQRRIGIAQALINDPDLLILDEPTSGMDPIGTRQFKELIRTLGRRGKTVILSSHLLADVEDVCDRVCILYAGRKWKQGTVDQLLARQSHTQIITDQLDDDTLAKIRRLLADEGKEIIEAGAPREKLEKYFLQIVEEASRRAAPGDAAAAVGVGEVADFLRTPTRHKEREVIESLLTEESEAAEEAAETPEEQAEPQQPAGPASEEVLGELVSGEEKESQDRKQPQKPAEKPQAPRPKRDVIDELIDKGESGRDGNAESQERQ